MTRSAKAALAIVILQPFATASAMILYDSPTRNTTAPSAALAGSGWQYQGQFGAFLGTPIAPQHFITAKHIGGDTPGGTFTYAGETYTTVAAFTDLDSDLRIWQVDRPMPSWAPLYTGGSEVGEHMVVFGRGRPRGTEVHLPSAPRPGESTLRGWQWGAADGVQSWGENVVSGTAESGSLLAFDFNDNGVANEAALAGGDSGGGLFINDGGVWKLAGINYGVDGPWRLNSGDANFDASLFDAGNMYIVNTEPNPDTVQFIADEPLDIPGASYATRISAAMPFIQSVVPEPSAVAVLLAAGSGMLMRRRR